MALRVNPPHFNGDPAALVNFVFRMEVYFEYARVAEQEQFALAAVCLEDVALLSFARYMHEAGAGLPRTWRVMRAFLERAFANPVSNVELYMRMLSSHERDPRARYQAFMRAAAEAHNGTLDQLTVAAYLNGLNREVANAILQHPPANLQEAVVAAERFNGRNAVRQQRGGAAAVAAADAGANRAAAAGDRRPDVRCGYCHRNGHTEQECRKKQRDQQQPPLPPAPKN